MEPIEQIKKACGALKYQAEEEARAWADARAALDCGPHETLVDAAKRVRGDAQARGDVLGSTTRILDEVRKALGNPTGSLTEHAARVFGESKRYFAELCKVSEALGERPGSPRFAEDVARDVMRKIDAAQGEVVRLRAEALRPTLKQLAANIYNNACVHGWWTMKTTDEPLDPVARIPECLALIHSEVSEALEAYRESTGERAELAALQWLENPMTKERKPVGFASELADVIIRVLDLTAALGIDIDAAIEQKHAYNKTRPMRHGGKLC